MERARGRLRDSPRKRTIRREQSLSQDRPSSHSAVLRFRRHAVRPLFGVHWAVNGFFEDQRLSPEEAIRAATAGGAYAAFDEPEKGTLESGKLADFIVLRGDPFETPDRIAQMRIGSTWIGGDPGDALPSEACILFSRLRQGPGASAG